MKITSRMGKTEVPMAIAPMRPSDLSIMANGIEIGKVQSFKIIPLITNRKMKFIAKDVKDENVSNQ